MVHSHCRKLYYASPIPCIALFPAACSVNTPKNGGGTELFLYQEKNLEPFF